MPIPVVDTIEINELDSCQSVVRLDDEAGAPVPLADLTSLELTVYCRRPDDIVNSRDAVDVKNNNGGVMHATSGEFTMNFIRADAAILSTTLAPGEHEMHYAMFTAAWGSNKGKSWIVRLKIAQLSRLP